ncbi:serine/threonine-protein kinase [Microlunatus speluncae]|uniref:serine/threonine-protein kinase n=1 Tax=Microlunatus speluncae TaxID=2594267 RepID=UPI0012664A51|nr:serine/threonine-protein kinase [Microlunatus speluncae]
MGEVFAGRYELVDLLAEGGMGTVWRVWDSRDDAFRAAKVLKQSDSASLLRFVRETSWRIDHDHVVTPIGWAGEDDRVLFTMPLVRGGTVAMLIKDYGALPPRWVITLLDQLLQALTAVHQVGLVHRDVKPGNLLLDATGTGRPHLRLTDFGIAAAIDDPRLTRVGEVIGTPRYLAPEATAGADPDPRQDLYAAGLVALELITGGSPSAPRPELPDAVRHGPLGGLITALLAPDPAGRIGSADQARAVLAKIIPWGGPGAEVEVFDQLPPLPPGWGPDGPATRVRPQPSTGVLSPTGVVASTGTGSASLAGRDSATIPAAAPDRAVPVLPPASGRGRRPVLRAVAFGLVAGGAICLVAAILLLL